MLVPLPALAVMDKPAELAPYIKAEKPYGDGSYRWMLLTAYEAALWSDAPHWSMDSTFALSLKYNMHFTSERIVSRSMDEMNQISPLSEAQKKDYSAQLAGVMPSVEKGDVITALRLPGKGAVFFYNGKRTGQITDIAFADRFFGIWLSEKTSAPDLRTALLPSN